MLVNPEQVRKLAAMLEARLAVTRTSELFDTAKETPSATLAIAEQILAKVTTLIELIQALGAEDEAAFQDPLVLQAALVELNRMWDEEESISSDNHPDQE